MRRTSSLELVISHQQVRWVQLVLYGATVVFSLLACVTLTVSWNDMDKQCALYAQPGTQEDNRITLLIEKNGSFFVQIQNFVPGDDKTCIFSIYLNAASSSYAFLWGAVFGIISSERYASLGYLKRTVFPSLMLNAMIFTSQLISSCVLTMGFLTWCWKLEKWVVSDKAVKKLFSDKLTCPTLQSFAWHSDSKYPEYLKGPRYFGLITMAQICSWSISISTLLLSLIGFERFFKVIWYGDIGMQTNSTIRLPRILDQRRANGAMVSNVFSRFHSQSRDRLDGSPACSIDKSPIQLRSSVRHPLHKTATVSYVTSPRSASGILANHGDGTTTLSSDNNHKVVHHNDTFKTRNCCHEVEQEFLEDRSSHARNHVSSPSQVSGDVELISTV